MTTELFLGEARRAREAALIRHRQARGVKKLLRGALLRRDMNKIRKRFGISSRDK